MTTAREDNLEKIRDMIKDIDFCMLTTVDEQGDLHSRPMSANGEIDPNGDLWFFTGVSSHKVSEIGKLPKVNVSFADPENQHYISITGKAVQTTDMRTVGFLIGEVLEALTKNQKDNSRTETH